MFKTTVTKKGSLFESYKCQNILKERDGGNNAGEKFIARDNEFIKLQRD